VSQPIRLGLLGCGRAAERLHAPAIRRCEGARLMGAYDPIAARRELIASQHPGCGTFESPASLVGSGEVDAVIVATPVQSHVETASLAMRAGIPVLIEKPLAQSLAEARRLEALQRATGVPVMVAFNRRWWEPAIRLRQRLSHPGRGPASVRMDIASDVTGWSALSAAGDSLEDLGTHQLDLLRYLFSCEIQSVRASQLSPAAFELTVRLEDGTIATCLAAYRDRSKETVHVALGPEQNCARVGSERLRPAGGSLRRVLDLTDTVRRRALRGRGGLTRSYDQQLQSFVASVRDRKVPSPGLPDGLAALQAIEAARTSLAHRGANIPISTSSLEL
jgi:myo-inositol 2-dehydrogenase / D-chiro-inositol 1-dehydrogenase